MQVANERSPSESRLGKNASNGSRQVLVLNGGISLICSTGLLLYLYVQNPAILTSTIGGTPTLIIPAVMFLCIVVVNGLVIEAITLGLTTPVKNRSMMLGSGIALAIASVAGLVSLFYYPVYTGVQNAADVLHDAYNIETITILIGWILIAVSLVAIILASSLSSAHASPSELRPGPGGSMKILQVLRQGFVACGRNYWQLVVMFFLFGLVGKVLLILVVYPFGAPLNAQTAFLISWLRNNNNVQGITIPTGINNQINTVVDIQTIYSVLVTIFGDIFYYMALGAGLYIVVRSNRGAITTPGQFLKANKKKLPGLFVMAFLFSTFYNVGLQFLFVPGILVYIYMIMAFPNLIVVGQYRFIENFGKGKDLINKNLGRSAVYVIIWIAMRFGIQYCLTGISTAAQAGLTGGANTEAWTLDPLGNFGSLFLSESFDAMLNAFMGPIETAMMAMLFIDLQARQKERIAAAKAQGTSEAKVTAKKNLPYDQKVARARYCPKCGMSVRKDAARCPNCRTLLPKEPAKTVDQ